MENNIFILNTKNELLLFYDDCEHFWKIPSSSKSLTELAKLIVEEYDINFAIDSVHDNNYICRAASSDSTSNFVKWIKYYDLVEMTIYNLHKETIENIYQDFKLNVILDIDMTLLESLCTDNKTKKVYKHPDNILTINNREYFIWLRPHLKYFLETISKFTNLIYWTAAMEQHQEYVLKKTGLDKYCKKVYYRDTCSFDGVNYYKDLSSIGLDINQTILIDDNRIHKIKNPYNCFILKAWTPSYHHRMNDHLFHLKDDQLIKIISTLKFFAEYVIHDFYTVEECFALMKNDSNLKYYAADDDDDDIHYEYYYEIDNSASNYNQHLGLYFPIIDKKDNETQTDNSPY
jgi:NLI interacting factor-like phosphatase